MTKADAISKIEELQAYIEGLDTNSNWEPGLREDYWCVDCRGEVKLTDNNDLAYDHWNIKSGNCFRTEEEAENYKMRLIAMKPKYLPKEDEEYWTVCQHPVSNKWDNDFVDKLNYYPGITFKTEKEAQEWIDTYGKYFEVEANA